MKTRSPIERFYDLSVLSDAGYETSIAPSPEELAAIAAWAGVGAVNRFEATVTLKRLAQTRFEYNADLRTQIVQDCVVTLEPVTTDIARSFSRSLYYVAGHPADRGGVLTLAAAEDESPEQIDSLKFDLAAPLLEEFLLAIDPYPRAPGVAFAPPAEGTDKPESPFATLQSLKRG